jgi:hypothetical protein
MNHVPNPLEGESDEFISSESEGYIETKVEWFNKPQPMQNTKHYSSKTLEAIAFEVHLTSIFPPYTDSQSLEATLA